MFTPPYKNWARLQDNKPKTSKTFKFPYVGFKLNQGHLTKNYQKFSKWNSSLFLAYPPTLCTSPLANNVVSQHFQNQMWYWHKQNSIYWFLSRDSLVIFGWGVYKKGVWWNCHNKMFLTHKAKKTKKKSDFGDQRGVAVKTAQLNWKGKERSKNPLLNCDVLK